MLSFEYYNTLHTTLLKNFPYDYEDNKQLAVIDLVTIMGSIYSFDVSTTKRKKLKISIPVFEPEKCNQIKKELIQLVCWVSGEDYDIKFIQNDAKLFNNFSNIELKFANKNDVTLFSGGLDSLTGAYKNYVDNVKSDYIGFINKGEEKTYQETLSSFYFNTFSADTEVLLIPKPISKKKHLVQATRSLLYLALAIAKSFYNESDTIYIYENGILSLNPSLNNRFTTKTTHPKTLYHYRRILKELEINININHPFLFSTKGEKINDMNSSFKDEIRNSFTCGAGRSSHLKSHTGQCGVCIPCLLRKISISAYDNEKYDSDYFFKYDTKFKDIDKEIYRKEYESNINYFQTYCNLILENKIHLETHIREVYYDDTDYLHKNAKMFQNFLHEFERFMKKYDPY